MFSPSHAVSEKTHIFEDFLKSFVEMTTGTRPLLVLLDGHVSHLSLTTTEMVQRGNQNANTDTLQPLDVTYFAPLEQYYEQSSNEHVATCCRSY